MFQFDIEMPTLFDISAKYIITNKIITINTVPIKVTERINQLRKDILQTKYFGTIPIHISEIQYRQIRITEDKTRWIIHYTTFEFHKYLNMEQKLPFKIYFTNFHTKQKVDP